MLYVVGLLIKCLLLFNVVSNGKMFDEVVGVYCDVNFVGCILIKIDEVVLVGYVMDVMICCCLLLYYVLYGQCVLEDIVVLNKKLLIYCLFWVGVEQLLFMLDLDELLLVVQGVVLCNLGNCEFGLVVFDFV